jgi:alpha-tubulin suppressor-like RCC1 family protein
VFSLLKIEQGQLGYPTDKAEQNAFRRLEKLRDVKVDKVAAGWDHSLALTSDGRVFAWGSNAFSQLGVPKTRVSFQQRAVSSVLDR